jgi:ABC-type transporter Mla MlaB component
LVNTNRVIHRLCKKFVDSSGACLLLSRIDEFRESRKSVAIAALDRALCDILCECPRGDHLRAS